MKGPEISSGYDAMSLIQTLDHCGAVTKDEGICFSSAFQWPNVLEYFATTLFARVWKYENRGQYGFLRPVPDILLGVHEREDNHGVVPLIYAVGNQSYKPVMMTRQTGKGLKLDRMAYSLNSGKKALVIQTYFDAAEAKDLASLVEKAGGAVVGIVPVVMRDHVDNIDDIPIYPLILQREIHNYLLKKLARVAG